MCFADVPQISRWSLAAKCSRYSPWGAGILWSDATACSGGLQQQVFGALEQARTLSSGYLILAPARVDRASRAGQGPPGLPSHRARAGRLVTRKPWRLARRLPRCLPCPRRDWPPAPRARSLASVFHRGARAVAPRGQRAAGSHVVTSRAVTASAGRATRARSRRSSPRYRPVRRSHRLATIARSVRSPATIWRYRTVRWARAVPRAVAPEVRAAKRPVRDLLHVRSARPAR